MRAEEPSRLLSLPAAAFEELFERDPAFADHTLQRVAASVTNPLEQARRRLFLPPGRVVREEATR